MENKDKKSLAFINVITAKPVIMQNLLHWVEYFGTKHPYCQCDRENSECDDCWDESSERDQKDYLKDLFKKIHDNMITEFNTDADSDNDADND